MVKKFTAFMGRKSRVQVNAAGEVVVAPHHGPVARSVLLPDGKSIKVLRRDAFEKAIERVREVA